MNVVADGKFPLVFDATCLSHFARSDRLDVLADLLIGTDSFLPHVVREEIRDGTSLYPELDGILNAPWLQVFALDTLERLRRFTLWSHRLGSGQRDLGEASVLAAAEELSAVALIDERSATQVARAHGMHVHGSIWLLATACRDGKLTAFAASNIIDSLTASGMRLPCTGAEFPRYADAHNLFTLLDCDQKRTTP